MSNHKRRLAAIIFTDIVDYTELSSKDEEKAYELVKQQRSLLRPIVNNFEGEWLKEIGDGLLLSFPSSKEAVNCAIKIQKSIKEIPDLNLRIGIHQGDIIIEDNDVFGDDINIASRIEPFAASGGIAVSQKIQQDLSSNPEFKFSFIDKPQLKGIKQEVSVYCITSHGLPKSIKADIIAKTKPRKRFSREILISTFFGVIVVNLIINSFGFDSKTLQSSLMTSENLKNPVTGHIKSFKHNNDILSELSLADSMLKINTLDGNLEALTIAEMLINEDSTKGDYYALRGISYFQRSKLKNNSNKLQGNAVNDFEIATDSKNINIDYLTESYIALSDINLLNKNLKQADWMIKKALRANKHFPGIRNKLKNINKLKLQGT